MDPLRRLLTVALLAGAVSGLVSFAVQRAIVFPLIARAEVYEETSHPARLQSDEHEWQPAEGVERAAYTAIATVVTGVGYAALLLGASAALDFDLDVKRGIIAGAIAFVCLSLAPAVGLPPQPPGGAVADLHSRQVWWLGTVVATATGLWLLGASRKWPSAMVGVICLLTPHLIGAPQADEIGVVPVALARQFAIASLATSGAFWLLVGASSGYGMKRWRTVPSALSSPV